MSSGTQKSQIWQYFLFILYLNRYLQQYDIQYLILKVYEMVFSEKISLIIETQDFSGKKYSFAHICIINSS